MKTFQDKVLEVVAKIKKGETMTYKQVARLAGSPRAYRAVGNILNKNYNPKIPCHRVIRSDGTAWWLQPRHREERRFIKKRKTINFDCVHR